ncbi:hypothetical protein Micbo1qcDRAFT_208177 [Microdochium bolleyi]|uniref:Endoglucanase n=1 Tax=Microdochium bolleyi TaxID=196109 RepID=A0A136IRI9_9PEZI|nr:hypothetical protein Micbo1qcDRAFT_208177 [Microdochium bolleyi]
MKLLVTVLAAAGLAAAHMRIIDPVPISSPENPNSDWTNIDYNINNPIGSMSQVPCKGAVAKFWDSKAGTPVRAYKQGKKYKMVMQNGGADHAGGSCQISLSYDRGATFRVIKSIIGGCAKVGASYEFRIPADAPTGKAVFSWSWNNRIGNREFYQDCAAVTIKKNTAAMNPPKVAFSARPNIFVANIPGSGWCVDEGYDVVYPNPGPDVQSTSDRPRKPRQCSGRRSAKVFEA